MWHQKKGRKGGKLFAKAKEETGESHRRMGKRASTSLMKEDEETFLILVQGVGIDGPKGSRWVFMPPRIVRKKRTSANAALIHSGKIRGDIFL